MSLPLDVRRWFHRALGGEAGSGARAPGYRTTSRLVTGGLALVYLVAFPSLLAQAGGLLGPDGILPVGAYLDALGQATGGGAAAWWRAPTLAWLAPGRAVLVVLCLAGTAAAVLLALGVAPFVSAAAAWLAYLSLVAVGQDFLAFQWDILLLEAGFLLLFLVPWGWRWGSRPWRGPWFPAVWLFRWLLFRLILESGLVKLASGDPTWRDLTALAYHYQTQPIPNLVAWYAYRLPMGFQKLSTLVTLIVELPVPFLFLLPRRPRIVGGLVVIAHQALIFLTGNFGFFNVLTVTIALSLFDDAFWHRLVLRLPRGRGLVTRMLRRARTEAADLSRGSLGSPTRLRRAATVAFLALSLAVGGGQLLRAAGVDHVPGAVMGTWRAISPFGVINSYGLFANMTTRRPELAVEGRRDGGPWTELDFRWKADDPQERPRQVAPWMPRLDWQMWFAALRAESVPAGAPANVRYDGWFLHFVERLLAGAPPVWGLLASGGPFRGPGGQVQAPDAIRVILYDYRFTTPAQRAATGAWWARRRIGEYLPPVERTPEGGLEVVARESGR